MRNVRIVITDLVAACRALGEVRVVAAGSLYATLRLDEIDCARLTKAQIVWTFD